MGKTPRYIGWLHAYLKVDGTVLPCGDCDLVMGNLNDHSLQEIWNGPAFRAFRRQTLTRAGLRALDRQCDCAFCATCWIMPGCTGSSGGLHLFAPVKAARGLGGCMRQDLMAKGGNAVKALRTRQVRLNVTASLMSFKVFPSKSSSTGFWWSCGHIRAARPPGWPTHLQMEPTTHCNLRCLLCPVNTGSTAPRAHGF